MNDKKNDCFEKFFIHNKENLNNKFVLIIGSGIHKEFLKENQRDVCNFKCWKSLFRTLAESKKSQIQPTDFPILDFERLIYEITRKESHYNGSKPAHTVENEILKKIPEILDIQKIQNLEVERYPLELFNPQFISDVIILNFDLILENLFAKKTNQKKWKNLISSNPLSKDKIYKKSNFKYRIIKDIRFWHPHGDIKNPYSIILGLRKYGNQIKTIEKLRERYKARKPNTISKSETWLDPLMNKPILILGAEISCNEWDILFTLLTKKRNSARYGIDQPIFQMSTNNSNLVLNDWVYPVSSNNISFENQWNLLKKLFK